MLLCLIPEDSSMEFMDTSTVAHCRGAHQRFLILLCPAPRYFGYYFRVDQESLLPWASAVQFKSHLLSLANALSGAFVSIGNRL